MYRPFIAYEGKEYIVHSISWYSYGEISHLVFDDENGKTHVAMSKSPFNEVGYDENGILHLDLEKQVRWGAAELEKVEV